jgi:hypothetical protein
MRRLNSEFVIAAYLLIAFTIAPAASHGRGLPSSPRSREVVVRQKVTLGSSVAEKRLARGSPINVQSTIAEADEASDRIVRNSPL